MAKKVNPYVQNKPILKEGEDKTTINRVNTAADSEFCDEEYDVRQINGERKEVNQPNPLLLTINKSR